MPFGGESVEDLESRNKGTTARIMSPMPFGGESVEDFFSDKQAFMTQLFVTNAFRRGVR